MKNALILVLLLGINGTASALTEKLMHPVDSINSLTTVCSENKIVSVPVLATLCAVGSYMIYQSQPEQNTRRRRKNRIAKASKLRRIARSMREPIAAGGALLAFCSGGLLGSSVIKTSASAATSSELPTEGNQDKSAGNAQPVEKTDSQSTFQAEATIAEEQLENKPIASGESQEATSSSHQQEDIEADQAELSSGTVTDSLESQLEESHHPEPTQGETSNNQQEVTKADQAELSSGTVTDSLESQLEESHDKRIDQKSMTTRADIMWEHILNAARGANEVSMHTLLTISESIKRLTRNPIGDYPTSAVSRQTAEQRYNAPILTRPERDTPMQSDQTIGNSIGNYLAAGFSACRSNVRDYASTAINALSTERSIQEPQLMSKHDEPVYKAPILTRPERDKPMQSDQTIGNSIGNYLAAGFSACRSNVRDYASAAISAFVINAYSTESSMQEPQKLMSKHDEPIYKAPILTRPERDKPIPSDQTIGQRLGKRMTQGYALLSDKSIELYKIARVHAEIFYNALRQEGQVKTKETEQHIEEVPDKSISDEDHRAVQEFRKEIEQDIIGETAQANPKTNEQEVPETEPEIIEASEDDNGEVARDYSAPSTMRRVFRGASSALKG